MTNEELNTELYQKLFAEQEDFKRWLLMQPPEEILKHAYEYVVREDIVIEMEFLDLTDDEARALLEDDKPLQSIYSIYEDLEGGHMEEIRDCIESRARTCMEIQREAIRNLPVYIFSAAFAKEHGELETYRASHRANVDCKNAIEETISDHYKDNRFDSSCVDEVINRFGMERIAYVLACTVQNKNWDGRISAENKAWAKDIFALSDYDAKDDGHTHEYMCSQAHPGLINLFINHFRKEQAVSAEKRPSVLDKLNKAKYDLSKKPPSKAKEVER